jgi:hypothetical protein
MLGDVRVPVWVRVPFCFRSCLGAGTLDLLTGTPTAVCLRDVPFR